LAKLKLPYPEAVFEINFFRRNPVPFYTLAHELYPGKFRPTLAHSFILLLSQKNRLHTCFTQNIDTLERRAGVPEHKIIEAHGSFANQRCVYCKQEYDDEKMRDHVKKKEVPKCEVCGGYIKPDIVFFGEGLPPSFGRAVPNLFYADLLIVMGTSLTVHPFASLAEMVGPSCPRVLINLDRVGDFGSRPDDVVLLGKCDEIVRDLCRELGWEAELDALWQATEASVLTEPVTDQPKEEGKEEVKEAQDTKFSKEKSQAALEAVEARLAKLSVSEERKHEVQSARPDAPGASEPNPAAAMAHKVAKQVSSAMKDGFEYPHKKGVESPLPSSSDGKL